MSEAIHDSQSNSMVRMSQQLLHIDSGDDHQRHPSQFIQGSARFITVDDGTRDSLALLVTENLMAALNDIWEKKDILDGMKGYLLDAIADFENLEKSISLCKERLEKGTSPSTIDQDHQFLIQQEPKLSKLRQLKEKLQKENDELKRGVSGARAHADWALETAMETGNLLRPKKRFHPPASDDDDDEDEHRSKRLRSSAELSSVPTRSAVNTRKLRCQEAEDEVRHCLYKFKKAQTAFDNKEREYQERLVEWRQDKHAVSQSEFDRQMLVYNQELTGALMDCYAAYEDAVDRAESLSAGSNDNQDSFQSHRYDESMSREVLALRASSLDRSSIEAWRANVPTSGCQEESQVITVEESDAGLVQISDSITAVDDGPHTKMINRWQRIRGVYEGVNRRWGADIWTRDIGTLNRRYSS